jgi:hypothetical protein
MIPAILAAPVVEGVLGSVIGLLSPHSSTSSAPAPSFTPALNKATAAAMPSPIAASSGTMTSEAWGQLSPTDLQSWMKSLAGRHVHATDVSGRTISGVVEASSQPGGVPSLNVGGHLVSLSQLNQITWSPAVR